MSDIQKTVAQSFGVIGLKPRSAATIIERLKSKGIECSDADGYLSIRQGDSEMNVGQVLQSYFKQHSGDFVGHSGEVNFKSDVQDNAAKVKFIREHGYAAWAALPLNENSPTAKRVLRPVVASTEMKRSEWLQLTPTEKTEAIASWGRSAVANIEAIMRRLR